METCDREVFEKGQSLAALEARSIPAEAWAKEVARVSGQCVDWHYSGRIAHVLVLGDHAKALEAAKGVPTGKNVTVFRWYSAEDVGGYRAGFTPIPDDVVAVSGF